MNAITNPGNGAVNNSLLVETCQAALTILPCDLAWLLVAEDDGLHSKAIATELGNSAGEVFVRLVSQNSAQGPIFPLTSSDNLLVQIALNGTPTLNLSIPQIKAGAGSAGLARGFSQLRLKYIHMLPLLSADAQPKGLLILATKTLYDTDDPLHSEQILNALMMQSSVAVDNARLLADLDTREEQMRVEQAFRKMVLDTMGDSLVVVDDQAVIRYANNRLLRMTGYTRDDLYGISVGVIFHPEGRETLVNSLRQQGRKTVNFSQQLVTKSGRVVPVLMSRATATTAQDYNTVLVLSDLTEQKRREQALERQSERLRALNRAAQAITSALTLDDVILVLLQSAAEVVRCSSTCLFLKDEEDPDVFKVVAATGPQAETLRNATTHVDAGIAGYVIRTHRPRLVRDVRGEGQSRPIEREGSSVIAVPLMVMDQIIGVLETINKIEGHFTQDDIEILENLAAAASVAIENARLFSQTQRRVNELSTLLEASAAVSSTLDIGSVLELIARRLSEALSVARCSIAVWDRMAHQLMTVAEVCNAYWRPGEGAIRGIGISGAVSGVLRAGKASISQLNDPDLDPRIREYLAQISMRSLLLIPLRVEQSVVGVIELYDAREQTSFTPQFLQSVEENIAQWREKLRKPDSSAWYEKNNLTDLFQRVMRSSDATWCVISTWDRQEQIIRPVREIGFALWETGTGGAAYQLDQYPAMAQSLVQGAPVILQADSLSSDPNEFNLMMQAGTPTGLIIPLLVRGEANGLVKLLDVSPERNFDIAEISLCQGIANVVGSALENAQLYQSLEKRANALQSAYDELRQADKVKDDLIQNLSHELQTPLHQMTMQLDLVINEMFGSLNSEQKENMTAVLNRITKLGDLVRSMMSMGSVEAQQLKFEEARLEEIIAGSIRRLLPRVAQAGLQIIPQLPPVLPRIRANPQRLTEVLDQLIDNAIKFGPKQERKTNRIEIRVKDNSGPMLQVTVQDYGIGIPAAEFDNIFQRGYQIDSSMTRRYGGTGLGLALARQIIEAHGGKIWVESTGSGGSQFHFTIPKYTIKLQPGR
jgi:PAS domain S-box-containing protein